MVRGAAQFSSALPFTLHDTVFLAQAAGSVPVWALALRAHLGRLFPSSGHPFVLTTFAAVTGKFNLGHSSSIILMVYEVK
jgi:hypothetical protein